MWGVPPLGGAPPTPARSSPDEDDPGDMKDSAAKAGSNRPHQSVCVCVYMRVSVCIARVGHREHHTLTKKKICEGLLLSGCCLLRYC